MSQLLRKYLNEQLMTEVESLLEFVLRSCVPADPGVQGLLMDFAHEEVEHIRLLAGLIARAGGAPAFDPPRLTPAATLDEFLHLCAAREEDSITRFRALAELLDSPAEREAMARAIGQEEHHRERLEDLRAFCRDAREG